MTSLLSIPTFDSTMMSTTSIYSSICAITPATSGIYQPSLSPSITHKNMNVPEYELSKMFGITPFIDNNIFSRKLSSETRPKIRTCPASNASHTSPRSHCFTTPKYRSCRWWDPLAAIGWITSLSPQADQVCNTTIAYGSTQRDTKSYSSTSVKSLKRIKAKYGIVAPIPGKSKEDRYVVDLKNTEDRKLAIEAILYDFQQRNPNFIVNDNVDFDDEFIADFLAEHDIAVI